MTLQKTLIISTLILSIGLTACSSQKLASLAEARVEMSCLSLDNSLSQAQRELRIEAIPSKYGFESFAEMDNLVRSSMGTYDQNQLRSYLRQKLMDRCGTAIEAANIKIDKLVEAMATIQ